MNLSKEARGGEPIGVIGHAQIEHPWNGVPGKIAAGVSYQPGRQPGTASMKLSGEARIASALSA
jgi:hypothetical protein